jgi:hypothetical protein
VSRENRTIPHFPAEYFAGPEVKLRLPSEECWILLRRVQSNGLWRNRRDEASLLVVVLYQKTKVDQGGYAGRRHALNWKQEGET